MTLSDNELIIKAQNGEVLALEELIYRYDKMVLRIAMKYTGDSDDAKDIYQEVFIRVYKNLSGFQFKSEFSTWLFRIATNVCINFKRKQADQITFRWMMKTIQLRFHLYRKMRVNYQIMFLLIPNLEKRLMKH